MQENTEGDSARWSIVVLLFVLLFFTWGSVNAGGVFFLPVIKTFGWSRARFAALGALPPIAGGLSGPFIGWLIDRAGARIMMIGGAALILLCDIALSQANSFAQFGAIFFVAGLAFTAATLLPCSIVISNWFTSERGLAMGITFAGIPLGGAGMTLVAGYVVGHYGWRVGYVAMGLPVAVIVVPALAAFLRERPSAPVDAPPGVEPEEIVLPGLEVGEALRSRSFWMIAVAQLLLTTSWVGMAAHYIPYIVGIGYTPATAAAIVSVSFILGTAGNLIIGLLADRLKGRMVIALACVSVAAGFMFLFAAARGGALAANMILCATVSGAPPVLMPMVVADSLGLRRLGSMLGITGISGTIGFAFGPVIAGRIFDVTGSYSDALWLFIAMSLGAAAAILGCRPLAQEQPPRPALVGASAA
jgi:MFS family permease